jgi:hypothetical protein
MCVYMYVCMYVYMYVLKVRLDKESHASPPVCFQNIQKNIHRKREGERDKFTPKKITLTHFCAFHRLTATSTHERHIRMYTCCFICAVAEAHTWLDGEQRINMQQEVSIDISLLAYVMV